MRRRKLKLTDVETLKSRRVMGLCHYTFLLASGGVLIEKVREKYVDRRSLLCCCGGKSGVVK